MSTCASCAALSACDPFHLRVRMGIYTALLCRPGTLSASVHVLSTHSTKVLRHKHKLATNERQGHFVVGSHRLTLAAVNLPSICSLHSH